MTSKAMDMEGGGFSLVSILVGTALVLIVIASFVPGFVKSAIFGYEMGAGNTSLPLRLPAIRPIGLKRGEVLRVDYDVRLTTGRLDINAYNSTQLVTMMFNTTSSTLLTLRGDAAGTLIFRAPEDGYYIFNTSISPAIAGTRGCEGALKDIWNAITRTPTMCPGYLAQYSITFRDH